MEKDYVSELIILAPNDYWDKYNKDNNKDLNNLKNALSKQLVNIRFATNGCTRDTLASFLEEIKKHINDKDFLRKEPKSQNPKYTHAANYDLSTIYPWLSMFDLEELLTLRYI